MRAAKIIINIQQDIIYTFLVVNLEKKPLKTTFVIILKFPASTYLSTG